MAASDKIGRPRIVLIVEDDPGNRASLELVLRSAGFLCHSVADGESALARLTTLTCDLVITDQGLPGKSGVEWLRTSRDEGILTPAIILSGSLAADVPPDLARSVGVTHILVKPVAPKELVSAIQQALQGTPSTATA